MVEIWRSKTPAQRLAIANEMWCTARDMIERLLHTEHPEWTDAEVRVEVARRMSHGYR